MGKVKLYVFVFAWFCTALVTNLIISCYIFFSITESMAKDDFSQILLKDFILSGAIVLVLFFMLRKQLKATFVK